jgi:hypothetical protein
LQRSIKPFAMVKFVSPMEAPNPQVVSGQPSLTRAMLAGFDAVSRHIGLILFSLALDLFLWLGPRMPVRGIIKPLLSQVGENQSRQLLEELFNRFNLLSSLRSLPIGIPSLMAARQPLEDPLGAHWIWNVPSPIYAILFWIFLTMIGIMLGTLYFSLVSQAAVTNTIDLRVSFKQWPGAFLQILQLVILCLAVLVGVSLPIACVLSVFGVAGLSLTALMILPIFILLAWIFLPLIFVPHGIFLNHKTVWDAMRDSTRLVRWTFPSSGLFLVMLFLLSEGLKTLWRLPAETSWLSMVGIAGHAFITAGLLSASFVYYHDADKWVQRVVQQSKLLAAKKVK